EIISGDDTRAGQQDRSVRKGLAAVKVAGQFFEGTFDLIHSGLSLEDNPASDGQIAVKIVSGVERSAIPDTI
ncbi:MAG: hypothetical protein WBN53_08770, partial [Thermodesulfobacteriota bacterium]